LYTSIVVAKFKSSSVILSETLFSNFVTEHNWPFSLADHFTKSLPKLCTVSDCYDFKPSLDVLKSAKMACVNYNESEINCVNGIISFFLNMYEHIFQHYVTFLQNGTSRAMTHHHSPGWWVMTHHNISRSWQVWMT
jgi:hypothetical protein